MSRTTPQLRAFALCALFVAATTGAAPPPVPAPDAAEPLWVALRADDLAAVRAALQAGAPLEARNSLGMTPLLRAAAGNRAEIVSLLLERGADLGARDASEYQAFDLATERYRYETSIVLLANWVRMQGDREPRAASRLALAAAAGDLVAVTAELDAGVLVDAMGASGYTALALAARWGRVEMVERLLARGAKPDLATRSRYGSTPLMEASRDGRVAIAERLIAAGASVNTGDRYGDHALNWACFFGEAPFVALMLKHGAELQRRGQTDDWPIEIAIRERHAEVVALLRAAGAKPRPGKDQPPPP